MQNQRETLKPKLSGNSSKSFFNSVLFPVPLGPEMTTGRSDGDTLFDTVDMVGAILRRR